MAKVFRFQFSKGEQVRFISHLDLMRTMTRSFNRARINLEHTEGFNPHPKLSFGLPLPVGVFSDYCYMDAVVEDEFSEEQLMDKLNTALPFGMKIIKIVEPYEKGSIMGLVSAASYEFTIKPLNSNPSDLNNEILDIFGQSGIYIEKKSKKGSKMINIKDLIIEYNVEVKDEKVITNIKCNAGSVSNLNPMLIWKAVCEYTDFVIELLSVERTGLYKKINEKTVPII